MTTIIDGGLATELEARGLDLSDHLWSARVLLSQPQAIEDAHLAYFRAGAQVATTASYQATVPGLAAAGLDRAEALDVIRESVALASRARDRAVDESGIDRAGLLVAGSVGPYGAMLADGSEYRGDYDPGRGVLREVHLPRIEALLDAGADLIALETIPTVREAEVLVELLVEVGATGWLSYQCRDGGSTAAGEPIEAAVSLAEGCVAIVAVGVNCTAQRHIGALLAAAGRATAKPLIAYPNGGDHWDAGTRRWHADAPEDAFQPRALGDLALGPRPVDWLGGCCGVGPADIRALTATLEGGGDAPVRG